MKFLYASTPIHGLLHYFFKAEATHTRFSLMKNILQMSDNYENTKMK